MHLSGDMDWRYRVMSCALYHFVRLMYVVFLRRGAGCPVTGTWASKTTTESALPAEMDVDVRLMTILHLMRRLLVTSLVYFATAGLSAEPRK